MHIEKDQRKTSFLYFIFLSKYYDDKRTYQEKKNVIEKKVKKKRKEVKYDEKEHTQSHVDFSTR